MFDLNGKKALITGATGGIGGEIAKTLNEAGAEIAISGTRLESLKALAETLGDRTHIFTCNLNDPLAIADLLKAASEKMGGIDILINNAGITRDNLFMRMSDEDWSTVLEINLTSTMRLCRGVLRGMMKARWGRIINIGSIVGSTGNPGQGNYAASKAALLGMSKSLANEVASRGITVNCIAPGFVKTAMTDKLNDNQKEAIKSKIPTGRLGEASDIAYATLYLSSEEASYITGSTIHVNGGMAML